ncbi:hypothetical protein GTP58_08250 [Duganella sp. CY15W]|uniref:Mov34/MPN/PAD-1 family protein n=1 Tax=Duganella sp. CY15W TaxID=2692172 RepID=UPI00136EF355|nr:Mov34/MPN/PAD-1 family protein [Duganella sp. CY15W]MYM28313.1 hypothetical protein [Duganella sp. CY15W]
MIEVILSVKCARKLKKELRAAGHNEIGGVLAAEQIGDSQFLVKALSVQRDGTPTSFVRDPVQHRKFMRRFHLLTGNQPERFNYLGEWHSHPSFLALPSEPDLRQMHAEIADPDQTASFLVLLILKLGRDAGLVGSVHAFRRGHMFIRGSLKAEQGAVISEEGSVIAPGPMRALRKFCG